MSIVDKTNKLNSECCPWLRAFYFFWKSTPTLLNRCPFKINPVLILKNPLFFRIPTSTFAFLKINPLLAGFSGFFLKTNPPLGIGEGPGRGALGVGAVEGPKWTVEEGKPGAEGDVREDGREAGGAGAQVQDHGPTFAVKNCQTSDFVTVKPIKIQFFVWKLLKCWIFGPEHMQILITGKSWFIGFFDQKSIKISDLNRKPWKFWKAKNL